MRTSSFITRLMALFAATTLTLTACGTAASISDGGADDVVASATLEIFDSSYVHEVSLSFDQDEYEAMVEEYRDTGEKEWIEATVTIDGVTYESAGIRLKGNSSLRGLRSEGSGGGPAGAASSDAPEELPWLIRLDEFVEGQNHEGISELVIRSNNSETSLNEAVALELIEAAGLATEQAIAVSFSVNGSDDVLRLAVEHPNDEWMDSYFDDTGSLYKAESTGDYTYRGDDPDAYDEIFDQEAGDDNADLTPLLEFLEFINESDDATFADQLGDRLDVDAFATYLAVQELIDNFDDIDGPGNNSYLYYDTETETFTVVAWDHNLAFGALERAGVAGGEGGPAIGGEAGVAGVEPPGDRSGNGDIPEGAPFEDGPPAGDLPGGGPFEGGPPAGDLPEGGPAGGGPGGGPGGGGAVLGNVLSERFLESDEFRALYEERLEELTETLYRSGIADAILEAWVETLSETDLVDSTTVASEAAEIAAYFEH